MSALLKRMKAVTDKVKQAKAPVNRNPASDTDNAANNVRPKTRVGRLQALLPIAAVVSVCIAAGYHTFIRSTESDVPPTRTGPPAGVSASELNRTEMETRAAANGNALPKTMLAAAEPPVSESENPAAAAKVVPPAPVSAPEPAPVPAALAATTVPIAVAPSNTESAAAKPAPVPNAIGAAPAGAVAAAPAPTADKVPSPIAKNQGPIELNPMRSQSQDLSGDGATSPEAAPPVRPVLSPADVEFRAAEQAAHEGMVANAILHLWKAIELKPNHDRAQQLLTTLLESRGDRDEAIAMLETSLRARPNQPKAELRLAQLYVRQGESSKALVIVAAAQARGSRDAGYRKLAIDLGVALNERGSSAGSSKPAAPIDEDRFENGSIGASVYSPIRADAPIVRWGQ